MAIPIYLRSRPRVRAGSTASAIAPQGGLAVSTGTSSNSRDLAMTLDTMIVEGRGAHALATLAPQPRRDPQMSTRLEHKTALVTGATSNIGRAIATAFAAEGAHVIVSGRNPQRGAEVVEQIHTVGGHAEFIAADLDGSAHASRALAADAARALGGRIDVLVNNAGIFPGSTTPTVDEAMFDEVYAVNVKAPFFLTAAVAPE